MPGQDQRRYNLPISDEVAVILPGDGTAPEMARKAGRCPSSALTVRVKHGLNAS
jgi:hypothetical protein